MKASYLIKSQNCLKSSRILFQNQLFENSTSEAYYRIYNSILSILFKVGIKSENHTASIILFDKLLKDEALTRIALWAKEERIDKQYYVETKQSIKSTRDSCNKMINLTEDFLLKSKILLNDLNKEKVKLVRESFKDLVDV